jgi:hypothetical protein
VGAAHKKKTAIAKTQRAEMPKAADRPANRLREATALLDSPQISAMFDKVRATVAPPPEPPPQLQPPALEPTQTARSPRLAAAGIVLVMLATASCYGPGRTPTLRLSLPGGARADSVVAGDMHLYNGDFFSNQDLATLNQLDLLKATATRPPTVAMFSEIEHIGYAALGNLFTVGLNAPYALWVFNLAIYAFCAWQVARLTQTLFGDRVKSQLAAALYVLSIAATVQVGQLSPQLLSVALSFLWISLLVQSEVAERPLAGARLFGLSALLAVWSLISAGSIFGLVTLAIYLLKKRNLAAIVLSAIAWYAVPQAQRALFSSLGFTSLLAPDAMPTWQSLQHQFAQLTAAPLAYLGFLAIQIGNFLWNDNPLNLLIGIAGLIVLRHRARFLLGICYLTPTIVSLAMLSSTTSRGAAVAGNTIVLFAIVAHYAVEASRRIDAGFAPRLAPLPIVVLIIVQAVWSHALLAGWVYPAASFETGAFENAGVLRPTEFARLAGPIDERPTVAGGKMTAAYSYGLDANFGRQTVLPKQRLAPYADHWSGRGTALRTLALQAPLFICLIAAALTFLRGRWSFLLTLLLTVSLASAQLCGAATGVDQHVLRQFDDRIAVKEDEKLVAHVQLSADFRERLERAAQENQQIEFAVRLRGVNSSAAAPAEIQVDEWSSDQQHFAVDAAAFLEALKTHRGQLELAIAPKAGTRGVLVHSWQSLGTPDPDLTIGASNGGRQATIVRQDGSIELLEWFPSFEIRVVRGVNGYPFKPLIERFQPARPAAYTLVGF